MHLALHKLENIIIIAFVPFSLRYFTSGIKRDKTMADKFIFIANGENYPFPSLQFVVETFEHST